MDFQQLGTDLNQLGVTPKDVLRASLYIDYLHQAQTYFNTTLSGVVGAGGLGANYGFVSNAVQSASLLQELADILDFFVAPAVDADLIRAFAVPPGGLGHGVGGINGAWTYRQYFDNVILDANPLTYQNNVQNFMVRYPTTAYSLNRLFLNFQGNILEACQRVIADEDLLTRFYADLYEDDFSILSLRKIKSTGSDFHKGGKQVLILTFVISHLVATAPPELFAPSVEELKVVYKPSDLEADCLIVGDSAAVNRVIPNFMAASLCEIYNQRLQIIKNATPNFTGEPLNTYRILPRNYLSAQGGGYPLPIRNSYGYLQYLDNDLSGTGTRVWGGYYPFGESDYLIFNSQNKKSITQKFYRMEGAFTALAGTFSLVDLHIENLRVKQYNPYPIDMEICLTEAVNDIDATSLTGQAGGITGISIGTQDFNWVVANRNTAGQAQINRQYQTVYYQNRLWYSSPSRNKQTIAVSRRFLLQGFNDGMTVLRSCQQNNDFNVWFARLNNVVVRYLPYATPQFKAIRNRIFLDTPAGNVNITQQNQLRNFLTQEYNNYAALQNPALDPNFIVLTQTECGPDYMNLDIPVFYRRISTTEIIDSFGAMVPIPPLVTIDAPNQNPPTRQARVLGVGGIFNRNTFFANDPTQTIVNQGQVQILTGAAGFNARRLLLQNTITNSLGNNHTNPASVIVPINT